MVAWDFESMYACLCDSAWEVGLGSGQRQQAEFFGPDCSQRKPSARFLWDMIESIEPLLGTLFCANSANRLHTGDPVILFGRVDILRRPNSSSTECFTAHFFVRDKIFADRNVQHVV